MKNVITRTLTGITFMLFIIGGMLLHPLSHVFVFGALIVFSLSEFKYFLSPKKLTLENRHIVFGLLIYLISAFVIYQYLPVQFIWLVIFFLLIEFIILLFKNHKDPLEDIGGYFLGLLYIVAPFSLIHILAISSTGYFPLLSIALFIIIWTNDTGAYCVGMTMGKNRLFERISPKKSWEGAIGGVLFSLGAGGILAYYTEFSLLFWLFFSLVVSISSIFGDLFESMLKRQLDIKDSGNILPGHGGILDRLDSALFAIPAGLVYINIFSYF